MEKLPKQFTKAYKASTKQGWTWTKRTRHIEVRDARGDFVCSISTTMYDGTLTRKYLGKLRRAGGPAV